MWVFCFMGKEEERKNDMATKKTTKKTEEPKALYKGNLYTILEQNDRQVKITDGLIHFWVKIEDVEIQ